MADNSTLDYYNERAELYAQSTVNADMSGACDEFLKMLPDDGAILDLGCGSGRDSKYFLEHGREVVAVDGSPELCRIAGQYLGREVICCDFRDYEPAGKFAGIWACASLLHLEAGELERVIARLPGYLVDGGILFMSFKHGEFSGIKEGRYFPFMDREGISRLLKGITSLEILRLEVSDDVRSELHGQEWISVYCRKVSPSYSSCQ